MITAVTNVGQSVLYPVKLLAFAFRARKIAILVAKYIIKTNVVIREVIQKLTDRILQVAL